MSINKTVFKLHSWVGLITGLILSVVSLTGVGLVFRDELDSEFHPQRSNISAGKRLSLDSVYSIASVVRPTHSVSAIILPETLDEALLVRLSKKQDVVKVYLDPSTGSVLDEQFEKDDLLQQVFLLHRTLLIGETGKIIMFFFGLALIVSTLTGLYVYRRQFFSFINIFSRNRKLRKQDTRSKRWHTNIGMMGFLVNLLFAVTGAIMQYPAVKKVFEEPRQKQQEQVSQIQKRSLDSLVALSETKYPDFHLRVISFPQDKPSSVVLRGKFGDSRFVPPAKSSVELSAHTGEVIKVTKALTGNFFDDVTVISNPLHFGNWGGVLTKIIYVLIGFLPAILSVTGFVIYFRRRKKHISLEEEYSADVAS
ncbi:MAG TPA: PepSY-associated TM helix domain-containing protein [Candidatus Kapabacteria bacterium]